MSASTAPIPISSSGHHTHAHEHEHHHRRRSSISSASDTDSPPHTPPHLPTNGDGADQRPAVSTSPSSPILSYLSGALASPTKSPGTQFPGFKRFGGPLIEEDEEEVPVVKHTRRQSIVGAYPTTPGQQMPPQIGNNAQHERGAGLLRRLSLGGAFQRPQVSIQPVTAGSDGRMAPPPSAAALSPSSDGRAKTLPLRVPNRRATVSPRRAPSPMGERILKGHFDGFN